MSSRRRRDAHRRRWLATVDRELTYRMRTEDRLVGGVIVPGREIAVWYSRRVRMHG